MVDGQKGIFGYGNTSYGTEDSTHVNLGVACITGNSSNSKYCTVGGGYQNTASGMVAIIGGGFGNVASDMSATVSGGYTNTASGPVATVGGGSSNTASGGIATVGGGTNNTASGVYSTVGGGYINTASGERSIIGGGSQNTASGNNATIGGGYDNTASGEYATIPGGLADTVSGDYSFAFGNHVVVPSNYTAQFFSAANPGSLIIGGDARTEGALRIGDVPDDAAGDTILTLSGDQVKKVLASSLGGGGGGPSTIKVHRTDSLKTPTKVTWTPFNMTSKVTDESIGTDFTWPVSGDSSKVQVNSEGLYKLGGCIHFINPGNSSLSNIKVLTRILQNGTTEARCSQRDWMGDLEGKGVRHLQFTGTAYLINGDYVQLQYYSNTDKIVFINDSAFMNSVAVTIWLEKLQ
jgi:hypothetical protein